MYSIENNLRLARNALEHISKLQIKSPQSLYTPAYKNDSYYQHLQLTVPQFTTLSLRSNPIEFGKLEDQIGKEMEVIVREIVRVYGGYSKPFFCGFGLYRQYGCCAKLSKEVEDARIQEIIKTTKERQVGGCEFQSWVVYDYLVNEKHVDAKVEVVFLENYDHCVVIIGQDSNTVVCDPWAFNCYPLNELPQQIQGLFRLNAISKRSWWDASFSYIVVRSNAGKAHYS